MFYSFPAHSAFFDKVMRNVDTSEGPPTFLIPSVQQQQQQMVSCPVASGSDNDDVSIFLNPYAAGSKVAANAICVQAGQINY